jgi:hypothetical protein
MAGAVATFCLPKYPREINEAAIPAAATVFHLPQWLLSGKEVPPLRDIPWLRPRNKAFSHSIRYTSNTVPNTVKCCEKGSCFDEVTYEKAAI